MIAFNSIFYAGRKMKIPIKLISILLIISFSFLNTAQADSDPNELITAYINNKKACDEGVAQGCTTLGNIYFNGKHIKQDYLKAANLYQKSCDWGHAKGCLFLGYMYERDDREVKQNYLKSINLFQKACDGGLSQGCNSLDNFIYDTDDY